MFAAACAIAQQFTLPVVGAVRRWNGDTTWGAGAFIVLNSDGWILTVNHLFQLAQQAAVDKPKVDDSRKQIAVLEADAGLQPKYRASQIKKVKAKADSAWITDLSYWWGRDGVGLAELTVVPEADLAVGRLEPFPPDLAAAFPVIKNPSENFNPGTSLCRLGFPFNNLDVTWDDAAGRFIIGGAHVFFPIEGMFTRTLKSGKSADGKHELLSVETSSPGLMGHSGGPLFDVLGRVWGIQSRTNHLALGFNPPAAPGSHQTVPQFINLGIATHAQTIVSVLDDLGVTHALSPD